MNYKPSKSSMESKRRWVCYIYVCIIDYRCLCHRSVLSMFRVLFFFVETEKYAVKSFFVEIEKYVVKSFFC